MNLLQCTPDEHFAKFSRRRRTLFPSIESSVKGFDLGCIGPLVFESDRINRSIGDYDVIGLVDKDSTVNTLENSTNLAPDPVSKLITLQIDTSPTQNQRTPNDITSNCKLPKLPRKSLLLDAGNTPYENCLAQEHSKTSKVRTALFPDSKMSSPRNASSRKSRQASFLCNRRGKSRAGEINAGVRHKIRKPTKKRSLHKTAALRAALNINKDDLVKVGQIAEPPHEQLSKKVFKPPSPQTKGVVSFNHNIHFEMSNGKMNFTINRNKLKRSQPQESSLNVAKRPKLNVPTFDRAKSIKSSETASIVAKLEDKENVTEDVGFLSPTSAMCNMTSGLAINSPKKALNLSPILDKISSTLIPDKKKLFPIFYPNQRPESPPKTKITKDPAKRFRSIAKDQMLLDAGQKRWGITQCSECQFVYHMGDPSDEILHSDHHNAGHVFRYHGWKNERVVSNSSLDGKVIQILPGDLKIWWKKVKDVMEVINRDLGFYDIVFNTEKSQIFFYIKNRIIIGVLVAEVKSSGHRLMTTAHDQVDLCSEEAYPVKCGVSRIWVSKTHRKQGVAAALMESMKRNFVKGSILRNEDIALSTPTELGKLFGRKYFKTDNFFIYFV